jgi:hypothetical protein
MPNDFCPSGRKSALYVFPDLFKELLVHLAALRNFRNGCETLIGGVIPKPRKTGETWGNSNYNNESLTTRGVD